MEISSRCGVTVQVRYIGVNTPDTKQPDMPVEPFGPEDEAAIHLPVEYCC
jgi:hypothetical protein